MHLIGYQHDRRLSNERPNQLDGKYQNDPELV
jgi:hypothetical protein